MVGLLFRKPSRQFIGLGVRAGLFSRCGEVADISSMNKASYGTRICGVCRCDARIYDFRIYDTCTDGGCLNPPSKIHPPPTVDE